MWLAPACPVALSSHLNMARWVCSCSSPLMTQEKSPKDSAPVGDRDKLGEDQSAPGSALMPDQVDLGPPPRDAWPVILSYAKTKFSVIER